MTVKFRVFRVASFFTSPRTYVDSYLFSLGTVHFLLGWGVGLVGSSGRLAKQKGLKGGGGD